MDILLVILLILLVITFGIIYFLNKKLQQKIVIDEDTKKINKEIENKNKILVEQNNKLNTKKEVLLSEQDILFHSINSLNEQLEQNQEQVKNMEAIAQEAYSQYCDLLDDAYNKIEQEVEEQIDTMSFRYEELQDEKIAEMRRIQADIDKIVNTRAAAIEAQRKEKIIKENKSNYCVQPTEAELADIKLLSKIRTQLNQPRTLDMLIWKEFYQKPMTALCNNVLGLDTVTGIYKITNQTDDMCYIGQAVDMRKKMERSC